MSASSSSSVSCAGVRRQGERGSVSGSPSAVSSPSAWAASSCSRTRTAPARGSLCGFPSLRRRTKSRSPSRRHLPTFSCKDQSVDQRLMKAMLDLDEHHWWYRGRRLIVGREIARLSLPADARVLDAGCGSGRTLVDLVEYGRVSGIELDADAAAFAASRGCGEVKQ